MTSLLSSPAVLFLATPLLAAQSLASAVTLDEKRHALVIVGAISHLNDESYAKRSEALYSRSKPFAHVHVCYNATRAHLVSPSNPTDVFVHSWHPELEAPLRALYAPTAALFEDNRIEKTRYQALHAATAAATAAVPAAAEAAAEEEEGLWSQTSFSISIARGLGLALSHETSAGVRYDRFLVTRPDVFLDKGLNLAALPRGKVYCTSHGGAAGDFHWVMEHEHAEAVRDIHRPGSAFQSFGAHAWMKHFIDRTFGVGTMKNDNQIVPQSHEEVYRKVPWHLMKVYGFDFWRAHFARFGKTDEDWRQHASPKEAPPSWTYQALFNYCCNATTCVANDGNPSAPFPARRCCDEKAPGSTAKVNMCRVPKDAPLWPAAADATAAAATATAAAATADPTATAASSPRNASATTAKARSYSGGCSAECSRNATAPTQHHRLPPSSSSRTSSPSPPSSASVAVLYFGAACRRKGWVTHDFTAQVVDNHRATLWAPLQRTFASVCFYGHLSDELGGGCGEELRRAVDWAALNITNAMPSADARWAAAIEWLLSAIHGAKDTAANSPLKRQRLFVVAARPDIVFHKPFDAWGVNLQHLNLLHFESNTFDERCGAAAEACFRNGWPAGTLCDKQKTSDALYAAPLGFFKDLIGPLSPPLQRLYMHVALMRHFRGCCGNPGLRMDHFVTVLDTETHACHNTRSFAWEPIYHIYGMRECGRPMRQGETDAEPCLPNPRKPEAHYLRSSMESEKK